MIKMPKYVLCHNREELPSPVILSTRNPYYIGQVWRFKDPYEFAEFVNNYDGMGMCVITGYRIVIAFGGTINGKISVSTPFIKDDILLAMNEMADFFVKEQIEDKLGYYRRFLA